jgi:multiple antibiotic resistance protein
MIGTGEIFTLFFVMLGPLKVLGPFVHRTRGLDDATVKQIAFWTFIVATLAAVLGGFLGRTLLYKWHVSTAALLLAAGIVFLLVALQQLLEQYQAAQPAPAPEPLPASPIAAGTRLVFPMVLTPYGIAAVIALLAASEGSGRTVTILGLIVIVMVLNLIAMLFARRILGVGFTVIVLQVVGSVLAVLQVALAVQVILNGLQRLGVISTT